MASKKEILLFEFDKALERLVKRNLNKHTFAFYLDDLIHKYLDDINSQRINETLLRYHSDWLFDGEDITADTNFVKLINDNDSLHSTAKDLFEQSFEAITDSYSSLNDRFVDRIKDMYNSILSGEIDKSEISAELAAQTKFYDNMNRTLEQTFASAVAGVKRVGDDLNDGIEYYRFWGSSVPEREFCNIMLDHIFHINEIQKLDKIGKNETISIKTASGKTLKIKGEMIQLKPVLIFAGGFNCRHAFSGVGDFTVAEYRDEQEVLSRLSKDARPIDLSENDIERIEQIKAEVESFTGREYERKREYKAKAYKHMNIIRGGGTVAEFNKNLGKKGEWIYINNSSVNKTSNNIYKHPELMPAMFEIEDILKNAIKIESDDAKDNKRQSKYDKMIIMKHTTKSIGEVELLMGISKENGNYIMYCISTPKIRQKNKKTN